MKIDYSIPANTLKIHNYRLLLFADNPQHMIALRKVKRHFAASYCGIWHIQRDEQGNEILDGQGKKHAHIILHFENARYLSSICKTLGFVNDLGNPDFRFVRPIGYREKNGFFGKVDARVDSLEKAFVYLPHYNKPDAEQYSRGDIFGHPQMLLKANEAIMKYLCKKVPMSESVINCVNWIESQTTVISASNFASWLSLTPYFKAQSSRIVWECLNEHNGKIRAADKEQREQIRMSRPIDVSRVVQTPLAAHIPSAGEPSPVQLSLEEFEEVVAY